MRDVVDRPISFMQKTPPQVNSRTKQRQAYRLSALAKIPLNYPVTGPIPSVKSTPPESTTTEDTGR